SPSPRSSALPPPPVSLPCALRPLPAARVASTVLPRVVIPTAASTVLPRVVILTAASTARLRVVIPTAASTARLRVVIPTAASTARPHSNRTRRHRGCGWGRDAAVSS